MSNTYKIHSMNLQPDAVGASAVYVPDLLSLQVPTGADVRKEVPASEISPNYLAHVSQAPTKSLASYAIPTILDEIGMKGLCIQTETQPGVVIYIAKYDECGDVVSGGNHRSITTLSGVIVPRTLSVDHQGDARLNFDVVVLKKDGNDAIVISDSASLPTLTVAPARWTLGPIDVGGVTLSQYTNFELDFGNTVTPRSTESDIYPSIIEIRTHEPMLTVRGIDPAWFAAAGIPIGGKALTHANTIAYLRKRAADGDGFVADGTEEHISFTMAGLAVVTQAAQGEVQQPTETELVLHGKIDSSGNAAIQYDGATAIT